MTLSGSKTFVVGWVIAILLTLVLHLVPWGSSYIRRQNAFVRMRRTAAAHGYSLPPDLENASKISPSFWSVTFTNANGLPPSSSYELPLEVWVGSDGRGIAITMER